MSDDSFEAGLLARRKVLGDAYVDAAFQDAGSFEADFQEFVTKWAWGSVWTRPGLSHAQRSLVNVGMLAAMNRPHEFEIHFRAALRNGCSADELREVLIQVAVYAGAPAAVDAFRIGRRILDENA